MLRARWPARIHKRVVEKLLDVVYDPLFQVIQIVGRLALAIERRLYLGVVTTANSLDQILPEQPKQTVGVRLGDRAHRRTSIQCSLIAAAVATPVLCSAAMCQRPSSCEDEENLILC